MRFLSRESRVYGVVGRDILSGETLEIRGKMVIDDVCDRGRCDISIDGACPVRCRDPDDGGPVGETGTTTGA